MSIAVARIYGHEGGYTVAGVGEGRKEVYAGLDLPQSSVGATFHLAKGEPILLEPGDRMILWEFGSNLLRTIAATDTATGDAGVIFDMRAFETVKLDQYLVSEGLLLVGFLNIDELRERREIFDSTVLKNGQTGRWK